MKKILVVIAFFSLLKTVSAQMSSGGFSAGLSQNAGHIYGKVTDSTGKGISGASVLLLQNKFDTVTKKSKYVLYKGEVTSANGEFSFEDVPVTNALNVTITATGFASSTKAVSFLAALNPSADVKSGAPPSAKPAAGTDLSSLFEKDLGKIELQKDVKQLSEIVITSSKSRLKMDIDKKTFNVDQNIVSAGGTAVDVMKNVPSVNVDIDGNVTMRNASPQIYIDGRPTTLTLDQIPADAIESIEVITNPSAKYDASGGNAGILNIVLKKNKKNGYNGTINAGIDKRGAVNGGASLNIRQNKINFSVSTFTNQMKNRNTSTTDITSLITSPSTLISQNGATKMNGGFLFGRAGIDYFATNNLTLSLSAIKVHGEFNPNETLYTDSAFSTGQYISYSKRTTATSRVFNANGLQGGIKYLFPKKGEELTADFNLFSGKNSNTAYYNTSIYTMDGGTRTNLTQQQVLGNGTNKFITMQADYVKPITSSAKIETGARVQVRNMNNLQNNYYYNEVTGLYELSSSSNNNYKSKDNVYAAYATFSNTIKKFGYQVGLRAESSSYTGELTDTKQTYSNNYPISLFPSLFLSQKLNNQQEVQLSVTRKINRPFFMQVIPFIDSTDQTNWTRGNANLKPEFTNSAEVSYSKTFAGGNTIMGSVYYKYTTNLITPYLDTLTVNGVKHPVSTFGNAESSQSYGVEITSQNTIAKWWDLTSNLNVYNAKINSANITGTSQAAMWSWFAKVNNNFSLPSNFKIQLSGTYQSKTNLPVNQTSGFGGPPPGATQSAAQGYIKANYGIDLALSKSFLKNKAATVTLSMNDIFKTRKMEQYSYTSYYIQNSSGINDAPMIRLNVSYKFGKMDMSLFKRKNMKSEAEGTQGAMQGIQ